MLPRHGHVIQRPGNAPSSLTVRHVRTSFLLPRDEEAAILDCLDRGADQRLDHVDLGLAVSEQAAGDLRVELACVLSQVKPPRVRVRPNDIRGQFLAVVAKDVDDAQHWISIQ
jgi:hypothetical protein